MLLRLPFSRYNVKIKWADINQDDFTIDIEHVKKLITNKTKAIVAVHLYGSPCEILKLKKIMQRKKNLFN